MKQNKPTHAGGQIRVKNLSAYWLPALTVCRDIGGTVYSVTGTYEGTETLDKKLGRILERAAESEAGHP